MLKQEKREMRWRQSPDLCAGGRKFNPRSLLMATIYITGNIDLECLCIVCVFPTQLRVKLLLLIVSVDTYCVN